jgi:hypothetical protein
MPSPTERQHLDASNTMRLERMRAQGINTASFDSTVEAHWALSLLERLVTQLCGIEAFGELLDAQAWWLQSELDEAEAAVEKARSGIRRARIAGGEPMNGRPL